MSAPVDVSVVLATKNRAEQLRQALTHLVRQDITGAFSYEIIVVDNGSTDHTRQVVEDAAGQAPVPIRYLVEARVGKPQAVNTGLAAARGRYLALTDDDVHVSPNWLRGFWQCFQEEPAGAIAGRVLPTFIDGSQPAWLPDQFLLGIRWTGCVDYGSQRLVASGDRDYYWVGGGMAVRREVIERLGGLDVRMLRGEDTELYRRCIANGVPVYYEPEALAYHQLEAARLTPAYARHWHHWTGYYYAYLFPWKLSHLITVVPLWRYGVLCQRLAQWLAATATGRPWSERFQRELAVRAELSLWWHRLLLWPRWLLTVLTRRSWLPQGRCRIETVRVQASGPQP